MKKLTTTDFIAKAQAVHGNRYDYSKAEYEKWDGRIVIICPEHGKYEQTAGNHLVGKGCRECAKRKIGDALRMTRDDFISNARKLHENKYNYDEVKYTNARSKVKIICPLHGPYEQVPDSHLRGRGCPVCAQEIKDIARRLPQREFIERAIILHEDKYDYSQVEYVNYTTKVTIICPDHGPFEQAPSKHLNGAGCPVCAGNIPLTTEEFIRRAQTIHEHRYNYDLANVSGRRTKVVIICPEHGPFLQSPANHLKGNGCPICSGTKQLTTSKFIDKAMDVHGQKYNYEQVKYVNSKTKVAIICPEHGPFEQTPDSHFAGNGCPSCTGNKKYTTASFIDKAENLHEHKYQYDLVNVRGGHTKVTISCPVHGLFKQTPIEHLQGKGCSKCGREKAADSLSLSAAEFIKRAQEVHGVKYDLSQVVYVNNRQKVTIICPDHGPFQQRAGNHLAGIGCPGCAVGGFDQTKPAILYYLRVETRTHLFHKIGITNRTVFERFFGADAGKISILKTWYYDNGLDALNREKEILKEFDRFRYKGVDKPLVLAGNTELFTRDVLGLDNAYR